MNMGKRKSKMNGIPKYVPEALGLNTDLVVHIGSNTFLMYIFQELMIRVQWLWQVQCHTKLAAKAEPQKKSSCFFYCHPSKSLGGLSGNFGSHLSHQGNKGLSWSMKNSRDRMIRWCHLFTIPGTTTHSLANTKWNALQYTY